MKQLYHMQYRDTITLQNLLFLGSFYVTTEPGRPFGIRLCHNTKKRIFVILNPSLCHSEESEATEESRSGQAP